jgi:hypothetical protein
MAIFRRTRGEETMEKCVLAMEKCKLLPIQNKFKIIANYHPADKKVRKGTVLLTHTNSIKKAGYCLLLLFKK